MPAGEGAHPETVRRVSTPAGLLSRSVHLAVHAADRVPGSRRAALAARDPRQPLAACPPAHTRQIRMAHQPVRFFIF